MLRICSREADEHVTEPIVRLIARNTKHNPPARSRFTLPAGRCDLSDLRNRANDAIDVCDTGIASRSRGCLTVER